MRQTIQLDILGEILRYWEEGNLCARLNYSITEKYHKKYGAISAMPGHITLPPLIGSELGETDEMAREIPNFKLLRQYLNDATDFDPINFLPRVPKIFRERTTSPIDYLESLPTNMPHGLLLFPVYIHEWLKGKKVCEIANPEKIELVNLIEENYFSYLPYDCFILSLTKPLKLPHNNGNANPDGTKVCNFSKFIIKRDGDVLKILSMPDDIKYSFLSDEFKKGIREVVDLSVKTDLKKIKKTISSCINANHKNFDFFTNCVLMRINILNATEIICFNKFENVEANFADFIGTTNFDPEFFLPEKIMERLSKDWTLNALPPLINGIGKLFANYVPSEDIRLYNLESEEIPEVPLKETEEIHPKSINPAIFIEDEKLAWDEVSAGNITFIIVPKSKKKSQGVKIHTGKEMPPHLRRGHNRHYHDRHNPEIITKVVWINQLTVRKDKLQNGTIHGSLSKYE